MSEPNIRIAPTPASPFQAELARLAASGPDWLGTLRRASWSKAAELGMPPRDAEIWRYSDLALLDAEAYRPVDLTAASLRFAAADEALGQGGLDGRFEAGGPGPGRSWLSDEARLAGVVLSDLPIAATEHQTRLLVREHLGALVPSEDGLLARNLALHDGGAFLYVPRNVELRAPVALLSGLHPGAAQHRRHLVIVEPGARLILDELSTCTSLDAPALLHEVVELYVGEGAWVGWLQWQALGRSGARHASFRRARLGRDAHLESLAVSLGADYSRSWLEVSLAGSGSRSDLLGITFPTGRQRIEQWTVQEHVAPRTTSDLLYRSVLADQARSLYYGTIRVRPGASRTDAYQANRNLLLSSGARADTNPQLEIANNDVRCTHGATVGPLDEEQLFYLMTRGLPRPQAERLLVFGFFADVLGRSAWSSVGGALERALQERVEGQAA